MFHTTIGIDGASLLPVNMPQIHHRSASSFSHSFGFWPLTVAIGFGFGFRVRWVTCKFIGCLLIKLARERKQLNKLNARWPKFIN